MPRSAYLAVAVLLAGALAACARPASRAPQAAEPQVTEMRTIESVDPRPRVLDPPPMLLDEAPPPKPKVQPWETPTPIVLSPEDEKFRAALPFSPAIAMDPVDGSKISMRANTPAVEYQGRIYYFSSEANRRAFVASPEQYLTGRFTRL
ncbi:MAG TPA: YHS domain-containing protein [Thermoanaerobaculia bacterium]|nr:YHS domain-containing protein [Thermoanaerobaculia bacterium]